MATIATFTNAENVSHQGQEDFYVTLSAEHCVLESMTGCLLSVMSPQTWQWILSAEVLSIWDGRRTHQHDPIEVMRYWFLHMPSSQW